MSKPPFRRHTRKVADMPQDVATVEATTVCPKGHGLPHSTARGQCTPLYCANTEGALGSTAGGKAETAARKKKKDAKVEAVQLPDAVVDAAVKGDDLTAEAGREAGKLAKVEEVTRIGKAAGRLAARHAALDLPANLEGAAAEEWADRKTVELLPLALAEVEYQLKFGDDNQRERAASKVLDMNGRGKKDASGGSAPTIIVVGGTSDIPWLKRKSTPPAIVEGQVADEKK